jgi:adenosylmethionine-8-amino-7-oxononanoate aminotransferase
MLKPVDARALRQKFLQQNMWIRPFGDIIYLTPAFTINAEELTALTHTIKDMLGS